MTMVSYNILAVDGNQHTYAMYQNEEEVFTVSFDLDLLPNNLDFLVRVTFCIMATCFDLARIVAEPE